MLAVVIRKILLQRVRVIANASGLLLQFLPCLFSFEFSGGNLTIKNQHVFRVQVEAPGSGRWQSWAWESRVVYLRPSFGQGRRSSV